jgi:hypothetical protein
MFLQTTKSFTSSRSVHEIFKQSMLMIVRRGTDIADGTRLCWLHSVYVFLHLEHSFRVSSNQSLAAAITEIGGDEGQQDNRQEAQRVDRNSQRDHRVHQRPQRPSSVQLFGRIFVIWLNAHRFAVYAQHRESFERLTISNFQNCCRSLLGLSSSASCSPTSLRFSSRSSSGIGTRMRFARNRWSSAGRATSRHS